MSWTRAFYEIGDGRVPQELIRYPKPYPEDPSELDLPEEMGDTGPLVSVIIPTYRDSEYLPDALESVGAQTYDCLEVIVIDQSNADWIKSVAEEHAWIHYYSKTTPGVSSARNRGVKEAKGELIAFLDVDDYWHPEKIERQVSELGPGRGVVYSDAVNIDLRYPEDPDITYIDCKPSKPESPYLQLLTHEMIVHTSSLLYKRSLMSESPFNEDLDYGEDTLFIFDLFNKNQPCHIDDPLTVRRRRSGSLQSVYDGSFSNLEKEREYLIENYPQLEDNINKIYAKKDYQFGVHHLHDNSRLARKHLIRSRSLGDISSKIILLYILTLFPIGGSTIYNLLKNIREIVTVDESN